MNEDEISVYAGKMIRNLRQRKKLSLAEVATALDMSYQQLQKYEKGTNRMSIGKLYALANYFKLSPTIFFPNDNDREFKANQRSYDLELAMDEIINITKQLERE